MNNITPTNPADLARLAQDNGYLASLRKENKTWRLRALTAETDRDREKARAEKAEKESHADKVEIMRLREQVGKLTTKCNRLEAANSDMRSRVPARARLSNDPATDAAKRRVVEIERQTATSKTKPRDLTAIIDRVFPKNGGAK